MRPLLYWLAALALLIPGSVTAHAQQAQELTVNILQGEPDNVDPNRSSFNTEAAVVRQVFEPLLRFDQNLRPQPAAASSYDVSPDGKIYTFHLRPDGRWSDGQAVTAQQFEYSWKRILDQKLAAEYADFFVSAGIVGAEDYNTGKTATPDNVGVRALDDLTLEIDLNVPFGALPDLAALWVVVPVRPDIIGANPDSWAQDPSTYIGNGPFMMTEWVHQDHITFVPNPYYGAHGQWPAPTLQKMTFLMLTNEGTDFAAYLNGERDWALVPTPNVQQVRSDPTMTQQAISYNELTAFWIDLNNKVAPLDNVLVRRAISKAVDRKAFVRDANNTLGLTATSIIPPGMPGFQEGLGSQWDFDPAGAQALLAQAGFPNGQGFPPLKLSFANTADNQRRAEFIQAQLKQNLKINIDLRAQEPKVEQATFKAKEYQLSWHGWGADYPDPQDWFNTLFGCTGGNNKTNYCNPQVDALVKQADQGINLDDRLVLYAQAERMIVDDMTVVPMWVRGRMIVVKPHVQNLVITALDDYPGDWFLDQVVIGPH